MPRTMQVPILADTAELSWPATHLYLDKIADIYEECRNLLPTFSNIDLNIWRANAIESNPEINQLQNEKRQDTLNTLIQCSDGVASVYQKLYGKRVEFVSYLVDKKMPQCWTAILCYLNRMGIFRDDDIYKASVLIYNNLWNFTDVIAEFGAAVSESGGMLLLYENVCMCRYLGGVLELKDEFTTIILSSISIIYNIVRKPGNAKYFEDSWKPVLLELIGVCSIEIVKLLAIFVLAFKAKENEDDVISKCGDVVEISMQFLLLTFSDENHKFIGFSADELLDVLAVLTVQDKMKQEFVDRGGIPILKKACNPNYSKEITPATKIICNLVLNDKIREELISNHDMLSFLDELYATPNLSQNVRKNIQGTLWMIGGQKREIKKHIDNNKSRISSAPCKGLYGTREMKTGVEQKFAPLKSIKTQGTLQSGVFISYASENKDIVHKIYRKLEEREISCWIDKDHMEGSTIDAMAEGIQSAKVFIVCMSSAYKLSHWGKMEADYAVKLKKIIIPTIVEYRYKPDGWVGFILGDKKYYEFTERHDFDEIFHSFYKAIYKCLALT